MTATSSRSPIENFAAVIPAGGVGARLWPLSRPDRPKFLLDLLGDGRTLLQATVDRLAPLAETTLVVTGVRHADAVAAQLPELAAGDILAEPSPRDSMAAIALAAAVLEQRHGPMLMGSFAADHVIPDGEAFAATVRAAATAAMEGAIVTLGIPPTEPSSAFGYIKAGESVNTSGSALRVLEFTEKPSPATAAEFIATGNYFWNAGMFVMGTDVLLGHLARLQPTLEDGVREIAAAWDGPDRSATLERMWPLLTKIAIDHAIAEPVAASGGVVVVPAQWSWHDVGDFSSLADILPPSPGGGIVVDRTALTIFEGSERSVVIGGTRPVAVVGLDDIIVVETPDALLVTSRAAAQRVKDVAAAMGSDQTVTNS